RPVQAQNAADDRVLDKIARTLLRGSYGATFVVQTYEARTTLQSVAAGGREMNPIVDSLGTQPEGVYLTAIGRASAIAFAAHSSGHRHKFVALGVSALVNSAYLVVAAHNLRIADQMRRQQIATDR